MTLSKNKRQEKKTKTNSNQEFLGRIDIKLMIVNNLALNPKRIFLSSGFLAFKDPFVLAEMILPDWCPAVKTKT